MIKILNQGGRTFPMFICDICGKPINDAKSAAVIYKKQDASGWSDPMYVHKGECFNEAEKMLGKPVHWEELETYIEYLVHNSKTGPGSSFPQD